MIIFMWKSTVLYSIDEERVVVIVNKPRREVDTVFFEFFLFKFLFLFLSNLQMQLLNSKTYFFLQQTINISKIKVSTKIICI